MYDLKIYLLLFLFYSFVGWVMEIILTLIQHNKFVNRGFLIGPYCPIYGTGAILITVLLKRYIDDPIALFIMAICICGILEYLTSYFMEKIFKARWWDYSNKKFNINGRICLETIIPFGLLGCFIMYVSNPYMIKILNIIPINVLNILLIILYILFIIDNIISFNIIFSFRKVANNIRKELRIDNTEEITKKVKEILLNRSALNRRLMNAFPKIKAIKEKIKEKLKE